jgi:hypothetical protein
MLTEEGHDILDGLRPTAIEERRMLRVILILLRSGTPRYLGTYSRFKDPVYQKLLARYNDTSMRNEKWKP